MNKHYCFKCRAKVDYTINEKEITSTYNGITISFNGKEVTCNSCGGLISIREITNENVRKGNAKYRDVLGIIKIEEIKEVLNMYNIGYKPLANLLGWSEVTIARYLKGLMPTKEYSDILKKIKNPIEMRKIYNANKNNITNVAQKKLLKSIDNLLKYDDINTLIVLNYFVDKVTNDYDFSITLSKLNKLMYFFIAWQLAFLNYTIIYDDLELSLHGPILKKLTSNMLKIGYSEKSYIHKNIFSSNEAPKKKELLKEEDAKVLNFVWNTYGKYENKYLEYIIYNHDKAVNETLKNDNKIIDKDNVKTYYKSIIDKKNIVLEQDEKSKDDSILIPI